VQNTVYAAFFLILSFFNGACLLLLVGSDFLGLLFLIIYVGAISVLFLFVIIILNLNLGISSKFESNFNFFKSYYFIFLSFLLFLCFVIFCNIYFFKEISNSVLIYPTYLEWISNLDFIYSLGIFSQVLYTYYFFFLLFVGFILLLAMVGSVFITLDKTGRGIFIKSQFSFSQISRDPISSVFILKQKLIWFIK
jgi:NADH-quinone oxidoreductase subunit J